MTIAIDVSPFMIFERLWAHLKSITAWYICDIYVNPADTMHGSCCLYHTCSQVFRNNHIESIHHILPALWCNHLNLGGIQYFLQFDSMLQVNCTIHLQLSALLQWCASAGTHRKSWGTRETFSHTPENLSRSVSYTRHAPTPPKSVILSTFSNTGRDLNMHMLHGSGMLHGASTFSPPEWRARAVADPFKDSAAWRDDALFLSRGSSELSLTTQTFTRVNIHSGSLLSWEKTSSILGHSNWKFNSIEH